MNTNDTGDPAYRSGGTNNPSLFWETKAINFIIWFNWHNWNGCLTVCYGKNKIAPDSGKKKEKRAQIGC